MEERKAQERPARGDGLDRIVLWRAIEQSSASVVITDRDGVIRYVNPFFERLTGYRREEALGRNPRILRSDRTPRETFAEMWRTLLAGEVWRGRFVNCKKDGTLYHESAVISPVLDAAGEITHFVAVKEDITEALRREEALRESMARYRAIFEHSLDAVLLLDDDGLLECNDAARRMLGVCAREAAPGAPDDRATLAEVVSRREEARREGSVRFEWTHRQADGTELLAEVALIHLRLEGRDTYLCLLRDVSDRMRSEREAAERQAELARRVDAATRDLQAANEELRLEVADRVRAEEAARAAYRELDLIFQTATGGMRVVNHDFVVIRANETLARMVGIEREAMIGRKCWETFPGPHCDTESCTIRRTLRGESIRGHEIEKRTGDGRTITCALDVREVWDGQGRLVGVIQDFRDLTETRRLHSVAEAVNTANNIGFAFSGIRHELGNPVNAVKTTLTVLRRRLDVFSREEVSGYLDRALTDVSRMEYLLRFLKSYNMYETPAPEPVELEPFFARLHALVEEDVQRRGITIEYRCLNPGLVVWADPRALQQVFLNLVTNAVDALTGRPDPRIVVSASEAGHYGLVEIADNGVGISPTALANMFRPFYTTKVGGTGLGLVIVKKMLAKMNGTVEVFSAEGAGTRILMSLPKEQHRWSRPPPRS